ncbi:MAG: hypothetical protein MUC67_02510 [Acidobacteria bacterium]|jgi:hypothetical protein|nr:hypothetical protein [Acidobacteriota bacterium]
MTPRTAGFFAVLATVATAIAPSRAASADDFVYYGSAVRAAAAQAGLSGDDLSPALRLEGALAADHPLRRRPGGSGSIALNSIASREPAVRVHWPAGWTALRDADLDGVPDRATAALRTALRTLTFCRTVGLGGPADDADRELDLYLAALDGDSRGFAVIEPGAPGERGAPGFAVLDASGRQDEQAYRGMVGRVVARLVLAGQDATAPAWWSEPSALWIQAQVTGPDLEFQRDLQARWNHPERGLFVDDPVLARGNAGLLWSLEDVALETRALAATWSALAARGDIDAAVAAVDRALAATTGLDLTAAFRRAGAWQLVEGPAPTRWALTIQSLPMLETEAVLPVASSGAAAVLLLPDSHEPEGTRASFVWGEDGWSASLLARRRGGGWDVVPLSPASGGRISFVLPWADYDRAVLFLVRTASGSTAGTVRAQAAGIGPTGVVGLSSFGVRASSKDLAEINWSSAWEGSLFGWIVERASRPEGPWAAVHAVPVPAVGLDREGTGYTIQDALPGEGGTLYYRVVALTDLGLRVSGPAVALRDH